jgi:hypothetical protein
MTYQDEEASTGREAGCRPIAAARNRARLKVEDLSMPPTGTISIL